MKSLGYSSDLCPPPPKQTRSHSSSVRLPFCLGGPAAHVGTRSVPMEEVFGPHCFNPEAHLTRTVLTPWGEEHDSWLRLSRPRTRTPTSQTRPRPIGTPKPISRAT